MTRFVRISLIVCVVGLLSTALIPVALAERPVAASGTLCWMAPSDSFEVTKAADGNVFISATEVDEYTGTFRGTGNGVFVLVVHPEGFATGRGQEFVTGTVMGKSGTWEIRWTGNTRNDLATWRPKRNRKRHSHRHCDRVSRVETLPRLPVRIEL